MFPLVSKQPTMMVTGRVLVVFLLVVALSGCAVRSPEQDPVPIWDHPLAESPETDTILRTNPPESLDPSSAVNYLTGAEVVFVGEQHTHPGSHRVQLRILRALHERHGSIGIGFELFRESDQNLLSAWSGNAINFPTLRDQLDASDSKKALLEAYRPILEYARNNDLPIRALKPDREAVQPIRDRSHRENGSSTRSSEEATVTDRQQKMFLRAMFEEHVPTGRGFGTFLAVQRFWEKRMASNIHSFLSESKTPDRMLVLTGNYHVAHDFGIPAKLRRQGPWVSRSVITLPTDRDLRSFLDFPGRTDEIHSRLADLIWWVEPRQQASKT